MTDKPAKPAKKTTASRKPAAVPDPGVPPLDAVRKPPARRRKSTPAAKRRGATAPPTPEELVAMRERERKAVELAAAGVADWDEIARLAGYNDRAAAWKAVQRVLDRQEFAAVADYRHLIGYRLERIVRANWEPAIAREESTAKDRATTRLFRAFEQIRRTFGLDLEVDKLADALRIPDDPAARAAELADLRDDLRRLKVVGGTDVEAP